MEIFHAHGAEGAAIFPPGGESEAYSTPNLALLYLILRGGENTGTPDCVREGETIDEYVARRQGEYDDIRASRTPEEQAQIDHDYNQASIEAD